MMKSRLLILLMLIVAFGAGAGVGVLGLLWATGGNATPSREAADVVPTLSLDAAPTAGGVSNEALSTQIADVNAKLEALATQVGGIAAGAVATPAPTQPDASPTNAATSAPAGAGVTRALFRIEPTESQARFFITEVLLGNPTTVVGATRRVAGDVIVNFAQPAASQIGQIAISARTLKTDNEFRDQSIRGQILASSQDEFEFITFAPTALQGLPTSGVAVGETLTFQIMGDLTIRGTTRPVTFNASVKLASESRLEGLVSVEIAYADWGLTVEAPPTVADVGNTVKLELEFVALRVE
jgi:polyisoprenoid-binding protein YceI